MKFHHHVHHHVKRIARHVQKHQHTYLFLGGLGSGVFMVTKTVLLIAATFFAYNASNDASFADDIVTSTGDVAIVSTGTTTTVDTGTVVSTGTTTTVDTGTVVSTGTTTTVDTGTVASTGTTTMVDTGTVVSTGTTTTVDTGTVASTETTTVTPTISSCTAANLSFSGSLSGVSVATGFTVQWTVTGTCTLNALTLQLLGSTGDWQTLATLTGSARAAFVSPAGLTGAWTGYQLRLLDDMANVLAVSSSFTVDHVAPILTGMTVAYSGAGLSGYLASGALVSLSFVSDELLTGVSVSMASGSALFQYQSGTNYRYGMLISSGSLSGLLAYRVQYSDLLGNTGSIVGTSTLIVDTQAPILSGLILSGMFANTGTTTTGNFLSGFAATFTTNEPARASAYLLLHGATTGTILRNAIYTTGQLFVFARPTTGTAYDLLVSSVDQAGNFSKVLLNLTFTGSTGFSYTTSSLFTGVLESSGTLLETGIVVSTTVSTGNITTVSTTGSILQYVKQEVQQYNTCKDNIDYLTLKLQIRGNEFSLQMPDFKKSEMKSLVSAFSLYMVQKLQKNTVLPKSEVQEITDKFNSLLVVLKLVKDDDNSCKQKLTNYQISEFKQAVKMYNISF